MHNTGRMLIREHVARREDDWRQADERRRFIQVTDETPHTATDSIRGRTERALYRLLTRLASTVHSARASSSLPPE